jgi:hypothetical protein
MIRRTILAVGILLFAGCSGSRQTVAENPELQLWVGAWEGMAIRENQADSPRQWTLVLTLKNGRLRGVMSDDVGEMRRKKVDELRIVGEQLYFSVNYETARGLQVICRHHAQLEDYKLLSVFVGREGGRAFEGKWEAKRIFSAEEATQ